MSSTTFSTKNLYNNLVNIFDNKNQNINQNINQVNNFNNNLTNYNNLVISNTNLLCQIPEIPSNIEKSLAFDKCNCVHCSHIKLIKESTVSIEFLASYKNINKIAKGKYLNNEKFQKATQKFVKLYINSNTKEKEKIIYSNRIDSSFDVSYLNPLSQGDSYYDKRNSNNSKYLKLNSDYKRKKSKNSFHRNIKQTKSNPISNNSSKKNKKKEIKNKIKNENGELNKRISKIFLENNNDKISNKLISDSKDNILIKSLNPSNLSAASKSKRKKSIKKKNYCNTSYEEEYNMDNIDIGKHSKNCNSDMPFNDNNSNYIKFGKNNFYKKGKTMFINNFNKNTNNERLKFDFYKKVSKNKSIKTRKSKNESSTNINICKIF